MFRILLRAGCCAALLIPATSAVCAEAWPSKALRLVVPYPPGGSTDVTARVVAESLRPELGWPVVIENKGGAKAG